MLWPWQALDQYWVADVHCHGLQTRGWNGNSERSGIMYQLKLVKKAEANAME
jgi:hypothetical protein